VNSEAHIIISFLFKRSGKDELKDSELYLPLSLELGWFSARESREFVTYAIEKKLLLKKGDLLTPSFDVEKSMTPVGFYPSKKSFAIEKTKLKEEEQSVMDVVVQQLVEKTGKEPKEIFEESRQVETEKNIISDVALLFIAKKYKIDMSGYFDSVEKAIFKENAK
jgi:hypothetical protein